MSTRKEKLIILRDFVDLDTGEIDKSKFDRENLLYEKSIHKKCLDRHISKCTKCPQMNIARYSESCPGWGNLNALYFFVGQSLHRPGIMSGLPFILGSGYMLDAALRLSGLTRYDTFISNVVHCHPPNNRSSTMEEKKNCLPYLKDELAIISPKLVVALGNDANWAVQKLGLKTSKKQRVLKVKHPASFSYSAPEKKVDWIVKLSLELDKVLPESRHIEMLRAGELFAGDKAGVLQSTAGSYENLPYNAETGKTFIQNCRHIGKKYKTIYLDPPWQETGGGKIRRGADRHYSLMSLSDIAGMKSFIDKLADKNCHLYLWTTNNFMEKAFAILRFWKFKYITTITWQKDRKGLGQYFRGKTEHCLFAKRGNLPYKTLDEKRQQGVTGFTDKRTRHSTKPKTMRDMIELVSYPPRIELFAREKHPGWDVWGDEV